MPTPEQTLAIRRYLHDHHAELRTLLAGRKLRAAMSEFDGNRLTRPPRGFSADSPALSSFSSAASGASRPRFPPSAQPGPRCSATSPPASLWQPPSSTSSTVRFLRPSLQNSRKKPHLFQK